MKESLIHLSSNAPALVHGKELLLSYLPRCFPFLEEEKEAGPSLSLVLASDRPDYEKQASQITKMDGFCYFRDGAESVFLAKTPRGVLYSVITYLQDDLGVRFYHEDEEFVPSYSRLILPKDRVVEPPFCMRNYLVGKCYDDCWDPGYVPTVLEQMTKNRVLDVYTATDDAHGGRPPVYGRNVSHNFHFYCPYETYGESHPEFYAHIKSGSLPNITIDITNGIKDEDGTLDESMDVSVAKVVIEEMKKDVLAHPECSFFSLTQEDGEEYFNDEHNKALEKKYKRSGILIRFCNVVVREVNAWAKKELGREIHLVTFGYDYASEAPVKEENGVLIPLDPTCVADENLTIQLALFGNGFYSYFSPKQDAKLQKSMREWKTVAKHFWFWAYDIDFANYYAYFDSFHVIKENVLGFYHYGITYLLMQGSHDAKRNWQTDARAYVYDRLMWDFSLDPRTLLEEYLSAYYGPGGKSVLAFIDLLHDHYVSLEKQGVDFVFRIWGNGNYPQILPKETVLEGVALLEEGKKAIEGSALPEERKSQLLRRMDGVLVTPLNTLYLNFASYFPELGQKEKKRLREEFLAKAKNSGETVARETFSVEKYLDFVDSEEYQIRPLYSKGEWHSGAKEEMQ